MENRQSDRRLSEKHLRIQLSIADILSESINLNVATQKILKTIGDFFGWEVGEFWIVDKDNNVMMCVSHWLSSNELPKTRKINFAEKITLGEGVPGLIWKNKSPCLIHNINTNIKTGCSSQFINNVDVYNCFGIPIIFKQQVLGMLLFYGKNIHEVNHNVIVLFTSIGKQIGKFIKRLRIEDQLLQLSQHDLLTGLTNRSILEEKINTEISNTIYHKTRTVLLYLDVDCFKQMNDNFGHEYGDFILVNVAKRLTESVREADTVARLAGDEFAILLVNMNSVEDILVIVEKILSAIRRPYSWDNKEHVVTISIGGSIYPDDCIDAKTLISSADRAMYHAKENGKNQFQFSSFIKKDRPFVRKINKQADCLKNALACHEFIIYYQPIVAVPTNKVIGNEALLRWRHPNGRLLNLEDFIFDIQENNLLTSVYKWTIEEICRQYSVVQEKNCSLGNIHLSLSHITKSLIAELSNYLQKEYINPNNFTFDIKESTLEDTKISLTLISALKKLGANIAIENYGISVSSINLLRNFMIDKLKIDRSFIAGLPDDPNSRAIVVAIVAMARSLKIITLAEGVENKAQLNFLKENGCDEYQGVYFSKPLTLDRVKP